MQQEIQQMVAYQGFAIRHVFDSTGRRPEWSYTVGLHRHGTQQPELFISGLTMPLRLAWLLELGFLIKGPPSLEARQAEARACSAGLEDLAYPHGGMSFHPGRIYRLAQGDLPACFGLIERVYYESHVGQAIDYHGTCRR